MNGKGASSAGRAFNGYLAAVGLGDVLDNRKPEPGTAQLAAARLIDAIKPFEQPGQ